MRTVVVLLFPLVLGTLCVTAQRAAGQKTSLPAFEVSSVRHNTSGDTTSSARWFPGRFTAVNARLDHLVLQAFAVPIGLAHFLVDGGLRLDMKCLRNCSSREEILSARFDIQATTSEEVSAAQQPLVLRALLTERFRVRAHFESREAPRYELTVAREGRLGPRLRPSPHNCEALAKERQEARVRGGAIPSSPTNAEGEAGLCQRPRHEPDQRVRVYQEERRSDRKPGCRDSRRIAVPDSRSYWAVREL